MWLGIWGRVRRPEWLKCGEKKKESAKRWSEAIMMYLKVYYISENVELLVSQFIT